MKSYLLLPKLKIISFSGTRQKLASSKSHTTFGKNRYKANQF